VTPYETDISETTLRLWRSAALVQYYDKALIERLHPLVEFGLVSEDACYDVHTLKWRKGVI
jgi:hypothetical protein